MWRRRELPAHLAGLKASPLFQDVDEAMLVDIAQRFQPVRVRAGEPLMVERFRGEQFLIIVEGTASIHRGQDQIATVGPGDFLGEIGLLQNADRSATVVAHTPMKLLALERDDFEELLTQLPGVGRRIREEAAVRLAVVSDEARG